MKNGVTVRHKLGRPLALRALLLVPLLVGMGYDAFITSRFQSLCESKPKISVRDAREFRRFVQLVRARQFARTQDLWSRELSAAGFEIDYPVKPYGWPLGVTEHSIEIRSASSVIARVYEVVLRKPNWLGVIGVHSPRMDDSCAFRHEDLYPEFWNALQGETLQR